MVDLRQIHYFAALARHLHFGRAAAELGISQPALSQQISALERSLGLQLFVRTGQGVVATDAGALLLPAATAVEGEEALLRATARGPASPGPCRVAYTGPGDGQLLDGALDRRWALSDGGPWTFVRVPFGSEAHWLASGRADVVLVRGTGHRGCAQGRVVRSDPWCAVLPSWHIAAQRPTVALSGLADRGQRWASPRPDAPVPPTSGGRPGMRPDLEITEAADMHVLVAAGLAVGLVPQHEAPQRPDVACIPLSDIPPDPLYVAWATPGQAAQGAFIEASLSRSAGRSVDDAERLAG